MIRNLTALLFVVFLAGCNDSGTPSQPVTLPAGWTLLYSPNMPLQMSAANGVYYFDFPKQDGVHYVVKPAERMAVGQTITMKFSILGDGKLIPVDGDATARVRILIQQRGDNLSTPDA